MRGIPHPAASAFVLLALLFPTLTAADDLAESLAGADLIVVGRVIESHQASHASLPGSPVGTTVYTIAISSVLVGVAEDSTLELTVLGRDQPPPGATLAQGWRVVAAGDRLQLDGWKVWGSVTYVLDSGSLWPYENSWDNRLLESHTGRMAYTLPNLQQRLAELHPRTSTGALEGAAGIALVTLGEYRNDGSPFRFSYSCDSLRWVYPTTSRVPRRISFNRLRACSPELGPYDRSPSNCR